MTFVAIPDKAAGDQVTLTMWNAVKDNLNKGVLRPISHTELGSATASITFSSIAADWVDLFVVINADGTDAGANYNRVRFNSDTGANYGHQAVDGATPSAAAAAGGTSILAGYCNGVSARSGSVILVNNYANSSTHKLVTWWSTFVTTNATPASGSGYWASTSAITSITVFPDAGNYDTGTTATLYGISGI